MISVRLQGGLGNQLFQYAAGRALALRHKTELLLDTSTLQRFSRHVTPRPLELQLFNHVGRFSTAREARNFPWLHRLAPFSHWLSPWSTYVEKDVAFNVSFKSLQDQTYLVGYWQSFRYFEDIARQLMTEFEPVGALSAQSLRVAEQIDSSTSLALHVRRGDYVSLKSAASFHGALPQSYYEAALIRAGECLDAPQIFVFSDDPEWCQSNLPLNGKATFITHNSGADAWQDLVLMGRCRHHVIANSSFSWWGAWIADQRWTASQRLVIAPSHWFSGRPEQNLGDRFPSHWEMLS
jgi:hypothetical protein